MSRSRNEGAKLKLEDYIYEGNCWNKDDFNFEPKTSCIAERFAAPL